MRLIGIQALLTLLKRREQGAAAASGAGSAAGVSGASVGPAKFIAVGTVNSQDAPILVTTDAGDASGWIDHSSDAASAYSSAVLQSVCYNSTANRWMAVGYDGGASFGNPVIIYSDDGGNTWTAATPAPSTDFVIESICWTGTKFIAVGHNSANTAPIVANSTNGTTWTQRTSAPTTATLWRGVRAISGLAIAVGVSITNTPKIMTSSDNGDSWTAQGPPSGGSDLNGVVAVASGTHVAVGLTNSSSGGQIDTSTNGTSWTRLTSGIPSGHQYYDVAWNGSTYVAVGMDYATTFEGRAASSTDASTWTNRATDPPGAVNTYDGPNWLSVAAASTGGAFVAVGHDNNGFNIPYLMYSANGTSWTARTLGVTNCILLGIGADGHGAISGATVSASGLGDATAIAQPTNGAIVVAAGVGSATATSNAFKSSNATSAGTGASNVVGATATMNGVAAASGTGGSFMLSSGPASDFLLRTSGLDVTHRTAYNDLINGLVTDGVWSKLDVLYIFATQNTTTALLNLVSSSFTGTANGSPTFTADRGYTGVDAATTVYIDSGFNPTTAPTPKFTTNSCHISAWADTNVISSSSGGVLIGGAGTTSVPQTDLAGRYSDGLAYFRANDNPLSSGVTNAAGSSVGHWLANRTGASASAGYKNGSLFATINATAGVLQNASIAVLANKTTTGIFSGTAAQITMASIGSGLTATDVTNFYNRLRTYMSAVGVP